MAAPLLSEEDRRYGLSCGPTERLTVLHVKLTETAMKAIECHQDQGCKNVPPLRPSIQFKGLQGCIKIPRTDSPSDAFHSFEFYLSNVGKDNPQGSFECIQQYATSLGASHLASMGTVQDKVTVCATNDSYQVTRDRMAQVVEDTRERGTKVIKPGGKYRGKQVQMRKPPMSAPDVVPERKRSTPINPANTIRKCLTNNPVSQRPYRDRLIHLLALKPYKKLEVLARLQRDGVSQKDRSTLGTTLQQVANLNPKDNSFSLKDFMYREIQRDWPGYSDDDKVQVDRAIARKLGLPVEPLPLSCSPKDNITLSPEKPEGDFIDPLAPKKPRISHLSNRGPASTSSSERREDEGAPGLKRSSLPSGITSAPPSHLPVSSHNQPASSRHHHQQPSPASNSNSPSTPEGCGTQDLPLDQSSSCRDPSPSPTRSPPSSDRTPLDRYQPVSASPAPRTSLTVSSSVISSSTTSPFTLGSTSKKAKKSKKHKEKDREKHKTKDREKAKEKDLALAREKDLALAREKDLALAREKDLALAREKDLALAREKELALAREKELALAREKDLALAREKDLALAREKELALAREKDLAREKELALAREKDLAREKELALAREKDLAREREKDLAREREKDLAREREKDLAREREKDREREKEKRKERSSSGGPAPTPPPTPPLPPPRVVEQPPVEEVQRSRKRPREEREAVAKLPHKNNDSSEKEKPVNTTDISPPVVTPEYLSKYTPLVSLDQRQRYKVDFNAEYEEYRVLHAHVESITRHFTQLDGQCKKLAPGSKEYQKVHDEVLKEYKKIKLSPNYHEEKQRCEYLHNKLAHIKRVIADFDQRRAQAWS
ncbi:hypothetical protein NHX12_029655 [Muraenolepis orangiensis]|uniref:OCEL domain-containing protein n=1 Tax=Muraenolepis orangiensis TaxID=630683 RepID=A0A9Q0E6M6_9TELE|nr:hypothetical protein NHX12_029655 [Muraenolepis orangiensis]